MLYGPDDRTATKITVGIVPAAEEHTDIRGDIQDTEKMLAFIAEDGAKSVIMSDRITGCPHEGSVGYDGVTCRACPVWAGLDRLMGKI